MAEGDKTIIDIGDGPKGSSGDFVSDYGELIADYSSMSSNVLNVEHLSGWHWCHICVTPFPNEGFLMAHKVMHINRAIAAR